MAIPLFKPFIKRRDMDAMLTTLIADKYGPGSQSAELVADLCRYFSCAGGQALREYRRATALVVASLGLPPGSRIALPVLAPAVWLDAVQQAGYEPVLCDTAPHNPTIGVDSLLALHAAQPVAAVVAIHALGCLADMPRLRELGLPLVEDCSQALGHRVVAFAAGELGDWVLLGMEDSCMVTAGGGTAVLARQPAGAQALEQVIATLDPGIVLADVNAALARAQMAELPDFLARRGELAGLFSRALMRSHHKGFVPLFEGEAPRHTCAVLPSAPVADVLAWARKKNIEARPAFGESIMHAWTDADDPGRFANAWSIFLRTVLFPLYPALKSREVELVEKVLASLP